MKKSKPKKENEKENSPTKMQYGEPDRLYIYNNTNINAIYYYIQLPQLLLFFGDQ